MRAANDRPFEWFGGAEQNALPHIRLAIANDEKMETYDCNRVRRNRYGSRIDAIGRRRRCRRRRHRHFFTALDANVC